MGGCLSGSSSGSGRQVRVLVLGTYVLILWHFCILNLGIHRFFTIIPVNEVGVARKGRRMVCVLVCVRVRGRRHWFRSALRAQSPTRPVLGAPRACICARYVLCLITYSNDANKGHDRHHETCASSVLPYSCC